VDIVKLQIGLRGNLNRASGPDPGFANPAPKSIMIGLSSERFD